MQENIPAPEMSASPDQIVLVCHDCGNPVLPEFYFCPNCARVLRPKPLSTAIGKQMKLYIVSLLLPPFGLWPAFKYLLQKDSKSKIVGIIAIILTIASLVIATYYTLDLLNQIKQLLGPLSQSQGY